MRFGFLNNFAAQLAAPVTDTATEIELSAGAEQIAEALGNADAVALTLFARDGQGNETQQEVVYATAVDESLVTVEREQEGTTAAVFSVGDGVEGRLTAGAVKSISEKAYNSAGFTESGTFLASYQEGEHDPDPSSVSDSVVIGSLSTVYGMESVCIGFSATAAELGVAIGPHANAGGDEGGLYAIAIGDLASATQDDSIAIGSGARAQGAQSVSLGRYASVYGDYSVCFGGNAVNADYAVCIGNNTNGNGGYSVTVGAWAGANGEESIAIGGNAQANGARSVAIGEGMSCNVDDGLLIRGLSYIPRIAGSVAKASSMQMAMSTATLDLASGSATVGIALPANTIFLPDSFDVIIVESNSPSGTPEIQIGSDDGEPTDYLAATPISKTAVGGRESFESLTRDGITSLIVSVATPTTGTLLAKVVVRGYVMEI